MAESKGELAGRGIREAENKIGYWINDRILDGTWEFSSLPEARGGRSFRCRDDHCRESGLDNGQRNQEERHEP